MKIGELAQKTGCKVVTIRYYEKEGLLKKPDRTYSNYRVYNSTDLERLNFIMHCRAHDMSMGKIKTLLGYWEKPESSCKHVGDMLDDHIKDIDSKIKSLKKLKTSLKSLRGKCQGDGAISNCEIINTLK